ncbi:hypothetical protein K449DRAFT_418701 [Hypoxylon sp. EC38]|nr:hypothetical protein K449DRAFT_418701 [Hypoxylon sp. EC38]
MDHHHRNIYKTTLDERDPTSTRKDAHAQSQGQQSRLAPQEDTAGASRANNRPTITFADLPPEMPLAHVCYESRQAVRKAGYVLAFRDEDEPDDPGVWFKPYHDIIERTLWGPGDFWGLK